MTNQKHIKTYNTPYFKKALPSALYLYQLSTKAPVFLHPPIKRSNRLWFCHKDFNFFKKSILLLLKTQIDSKSIKQFYDVVSRRELRTLIYTLFKRSLDKLTLLANLLFLLTLFQPCHPIYYKNFKNKNSLINLSTTFMKKFTYAYLKHAHLAPTNQRACFFVTPYVWESVWLDTVSGLGSRSSQTLTAGSFSQKNSTKNDYSLNTTVAMGGSPIFLFRFVKFTYFSLGVTWREDTISSKKSITSFIKYFLDSRFIFKQKKFWKTQLYLTYMVTF